MHYVIHTEIKDLFSITEELFGIESVWYELGLALDIDPGKLESIASNHKGKVEKCMNDMLSEWLHGNGKYPITWRTLLDALRTKKVGKTAEANDIKEKIESSIN